MENHEKISCDILVIGAGIAGLSAALEAAETGYTVTLIEKRPYIGGRVAQLNQYFPKMCPPSCGLEINTKRLKDNKLVNLLTNTELKHIDGKPCAYKAEIKIKPRYIREDVSEEIIEKCAAECDILIEDEFNYGMQKVKALHIPSNNVYPMKYIFEKDKLNEEQLHKVYHSCSTCLDLSQQEEIKEVEAKAVIYATGWKPYDAKNMDILSYDKYPNVITNVEMERLASPSGPTGGVIQIPGMNKEIKRVAFVQCAGSRDETNLDYCSSVCCLASMKHARFIREQMPETEIHVFYIDIRSPGAFEDFYADTQKDEKVFWHRGKVAKVFENYQNKELIVEAEDTIAGKLKQYEVDLVVLGTGMQPMLNGNFPFKDLLDDSGFIRTDIDNSVIGCGVATGPKNVAEVVQDATSAVMKAIHIIRGGN